MKGLGDKVEETETEKLKKIQLCGKYIGGARGKQDIDKSYDKRIKENKK